MKQAEEVNEAREAEGWLSQERNVGVDAGFIALFFELSLLRGQWRGQKSVRVSAVRIYVYEKRSNVH